MGLTTIAAVIPARWASVRFPGKPLAPIDGRPMIQWVYERSSKAESIDQVIVATDDERILHTVQSFGGEAVMTPRDLASGTERVAFVARSLSANIVVNIQGDEPLIEPQAIDKVAERLLLDDKASMATLARRITDPAELRNYDTARVVIDKDQRALYFSRAVIPYARDLHSLELWPKEFPYYDQIGIYAFRREFLLTYNELGYSALEQAEKLEQLRALENGYTISVGLVDFSPVCVDIPEHIQWVEQRLREMKNRE
jgi:3-deoxy-manno-octulosonate cytidylyltransferase (CMP-KDO synthetase)